MKISTILLATAIAVAVVSCKEQKVQTLDAKQFSAVIDSLPNEQLVDVRTAEEFNKEHLANAVNMDWNGGDFENLAKGLDKSKPVMVYCLSGARSAEASAFLAKQGYNVYTLNGGIRSWESAGLPVTQGSAPQQEQANGTITPSGYVGLTKSNPLVLVDFSAVWCGPCKLLAPRLDEVAKDRPEVKIIKSDVDRDRALADSMHIDAIPALRLYKNGQLMWSGEGLMEKETIEKAIDDLK